MKLRVGFIGVGAMGFSHLKAVCDNHPTAVEVTAICATRKMNIQRALGVAPHAEVFSNEKQLIQSDVDAIFLSSPNFLHVPLALEILRAGKHLYLEKPVGITREECWRLVDAADRTDRVVLVGHELRYSPYFAKVKTLVDTGGIGRPSMVWCRELRGPFQNKSRNWIHDNRKSGGALVDKNCHHFDLMNWWIGARPKRVCAFGGNSVHRRFEHEHQVLDHATVSFEYENGVRGTLQLCLFARDFPDEELEMGIVGDAGTLQMRHGSPRPNASFRAPALDHPCPPINDEREQGGEASRSRPDSAERGTLEILQWRRGAPCGNPIVHSVQASQDQGWGGHLGFAEIHEAFLRAVLANEPHRTTVRDCVDGSLLAIAAEESIKQTKIIEIN